MSTTAAPAERQRTGVRRRLLHRGPWTWANVAGGLVGVVAVVLGAVALARTGIPAGTFGGPHVVAGWLHHTPLLAVAHLLGGAGLLAASVRPTRDPSRLSVAGVVVAVAGIVLTVEPSAFHRLFGIHAAHGLTYLAAGAGLAVAGFASPVYERTVAEEVVE